VNRRSCRKRTHHRFKNINAEIAMISKAIANSETNTIPVGFGKTGADGDRGKTPGWSAR